MDTNTQTWQERFDENFSIKGGMLIEKGARDFLLYFIQKLLSETEERVRREERERVKEWLEDQRIVPKTNDTFQTKYETEATNSMIDETLYFLSTL